MVKHVVKGPCSSKMRCKVNAGSPSVYKASRDFEFFDLPGGVTRSQTKRATICATPRRSRPQIPSAAGVKLLYSKPAAGVKALRDLAREQHEVGRVRRAVAVQVGGAEGRFVKSLVVGEEPLEKPQVGGVDRAGGVEVPRDHDGVQRAVDHRGLVGLELSGGRHHVLCVDLHVGRRKRIAQPRSRHAHGKETV